MERLKGNRGQANSLFYNIISSPAPNRAYISSSVLRRRLEPQHGCLPVSCTHPCSWVLTSARQGESSRSLHGPWAAPAACFPLKRGEELVPSCSPGDGHMLIFWLWLPITVGVSRGTRLLLATPSVCLESGIRSQLYF